MEEIQQPQRILEMENAAHLKELLCGWNEAGVAHDGLQDDASNLVLVGLKDRAHALQVIVRGRQCGGCSAQLLSPSCDHS